MEALQYEAVTVQIDRGSDDGVLGFALSGGASEGRLIYISDILPDSPAIYKLALNDEIISFQGMNVTRMKKSEFRTLLRNSSAKIKIFWIKIRHFHFVLCFDFRIERLNVSQSLFKQN